MLLRKTGRPGQKKRILFLGNKATGCVENNKGLWGKRQERTQNKATEFIENM
jgi:hypothetical protein